MHMPTEAANVSIRYTLALEDGTLLSSSVGGDRLDYTRGQEQIIPAIEEALRGAAPGDKKRIVLSPVADPSLQLDATRLALLIGRAGETVVPTVEIL